MKISHSRSQCYRAPQTPGEEGNAQVFKATSDEAETQARHSIVQGELHFGRRDLGRTCLAAGACSTTTGGETAALLPLTAMCRTPRALTSTNRRGVVRSRNQRGVARIGQERSAGANEALSAITSTKSPASIRQKCNDEDYRLQATGIEESDDEPRKRQWRRRRTEDSILIRAFSVGL